MHDHPIPGPAHPVPASAAGTLAAGHALRALERLSRGPRSAPELASELGIDPRSARRLLHRLRAEGYAVQEPGHRRRYRATLRLAAVAGELLRADPLRAAATGVLTELAGSTGGTAHLWVSQGASVWCLAHCRPSDPAAVHLGGERIVLRDDAEAEGPAGAVLAPSRAATRSTAYLRSGPEDASLASAIVDRGRVVAAVGLSGALDVGAATALRDARQALEASLRRLPLS